jgi:hypothetical protein
MGILLLMLALSAAPQTGNGVIRVVVQNPGTMAPIAGAQVVLAPPGTVAAITTPLLQSLRLPTNGTVIVDGVLSTTMASGARISEIRIVNSGGTSVVNITTQSDFGTNALPPPGSVTAVTDARGIATFRNLGAGDYVVSARLDGHVAVPADVRVTDQQATREVSLLLVRAATIAGRITNESGSPLSGLRVTAMAVGYQDGRRALLQSGPVVSTNGNGEYQLLSLLPGAYYIQALDTAFGVYYPGVGNASEATMIPIRGGEEVLGINFVHRMKGFNISGKVTSPATISSFAVIRPNGDQLAPTNPTPVRNMSPTPDGGFSLVGIPAGTWDLMPVTASTSGRVRVNVVDRDIEGLSIPLSFSRDINGRIHLEGAPQEPITALAGISLLAPEVPPGQIRHLQNQVVGPNGEFAFRMAPPGDYRIQTQPPPGYYLADIRLGALSIYSDGALTIASEPVPLGPLEIVMRPGGGRITGTVQGATDGKTVRVVLIPSQERRKNSLLYKTATLSAGDRSFSFSNVAPGEYSVFAWAGLPPGGAEQDPEFTAPYEPFASRITVVDGGAIEVRPNLISVK